MTKDIIIYMLISILSGSTISDYQRHGFTAYEVFVIVIIVVALIGMQFE